MRGFFFINIWFKGIFISMKYGCNRLLNIDHLSPNKKNMEQAPWIPDQNSRRHVRNLVGSFPIAQQNIYRAWKNSGLSFAGLKISHRKKLLNPPIDEFRVARNNHRPFPRPGTFETFGRDIRLKNGPVRIVTGTESFFFRLGIGLFFFVHFKLKQLSDGFWRIF